MHTLYLVEGAQLVHLRPLVQRIHDFSRLRHLRASAVAPMTRHLQHPTPAATTTASMRVSRWSLRLAVPACTAGGPQASRKCSGGGRRRRRSTIHAGGAGAPSPITTPTTATRSSIFGHLPQLCVLHQRWPVTRVNGGMAPPDEPALQRARKGVQMPVQLELGPLPAPSHLLPSEWCLDLCSGQRSAPAASARRPMIWASSRPPSPPLPASLPAAAVSRARCATHTREIRCACARVATCAATVRLDAAAATAAPPVPRALVVHDSHRPVCCTDAGHSASAAPLQRSLGAPLLPATETAGRPERAGTVAMRSRR